MGIPTTNNGWAPRVQVAVESSAGSGAFEVDDRLSAEEAESLADDRIAKAVVDIQTDATFTPAEAQERYHPDRRVIVFSPDAVLFDGYPTESRLSWLTPGVRIPPRRGEFRLFLEHVVGRLSRDPDARIFGRHVRDTEIEAGLSVDPVKWAGASRLLTALPCIFNRDGVANCDPTPIEVRDQVGGVRKIHIFTYDGRADAISWTYVRALRYLFYFYNCQNRPVQSGEVLKQTDAIAMQPPVGKGIDPVDRLLGRPLHLVAEFTSLLQALRRMTDVSGIHFTTRSQRIGRGVQTSWRIWSATGGLERDLKLASSARDAAGQPVFEPASMTAAEVFENNNLSAAQLRWDTRNTGNTAVVVGGVKHYEIQAQLLAGWLPQAGLDNVDPSQRDSAKSTALSNTQIQSLGTMVVDDPWYRQFHHDGAEFSSNWQVGRLWVLNEAGTYSQMQYGRNAPFDDYSPFDFSTIGPGPWMRRLRTLLPLRRLPADEPRVIVETSFDNGGSWIRLDAGYTVLADECGIWLDVPNLVSIAPPSGSTNLWAALVDQTFRLRICSLIEADERLMVRRINDKVPTLFNSAIVHYAPRRFQFVHRLNSPAALPSGNGDIPLGDVDDTTMMQQTADRIAADAAGNVTGRAVIPWLDTDYDIGDRIMGVRGRGLDLATQRAGSLRYACVVGKRYRLGSSRMRTELLLGSADTFCDRVEQED